MIVCRNKCLASLVSVNDFKKMFEVPVVKHEKLYLKHELKMLEICCAYA